MTLLSTDALADALLATVDTDHRTPVDFARLRASLLALDADARGALVTERLQTYAKSVPFVYGRGFPAASFVLDVTDHREATVAAFAMVHNRLTARRAYHRVALAGEEAAFYADLFAAAGAGRSLHIAALLTWHHDDASIVTLVLDALLRHPEPAARGALKWVTRFDKANRARAVTLLTRLGDDALDMIEALCMSEETAGREVALSALAAMPYSVAARVVARRVRTKVKGVPKTVKEAVLAMAEAAPAETDTVAPMEPPVMVAKRRRAKLPPLPDTSEAEASLAALRAKGDSVSKSSRAAFFKTLLEGDPAAIDAAVDTLGAPAMALAVRWLYTLPKVDDASQAERLMRVMMRVPVEIDTATEAVLTVIWQVLFNEREVTPVLERFATHLLGPATLALSGGLVWNRQALIAVLAKHHAHAGYRLFLDALGDDRSWPEAAAVLDARGVEAIDGCAAILTGKDVRKGIGAARYFARIAHPEALPLLEHARLRVKMPVAHELHHAITLTQKAAKEGAP